MSEAKYIDADEFVKEKREWYCKQCLKRKGMKRGKLQFVYEIGDVPCRACDVDDVISDIEDFPAADVEPKRKWIPVTERLPELGQFVPDGPIASTKVFFKTSDKTIHLGYLTEFSYVDKHAGMIVLHRWYDDHGDRIENVTKWCEPPKEEEDMEVIDGR